MSNTFSKTVDVSSVTRGLAESLTHMAISCLSAAHHRVQRARTKKMLCSLSDEQLKDAGIDRALIHTGPQIEVDARLMSTLKSLR